MTTNHAAPTPVMPPTLGQLTREAHLMDFDAPEVEVGDIEGIPVVRVTLKGSGMFRDVEAVCQVGTGYRSGDRIVEMSPREAEYLATRSAFAEALVLAMAPEAKR